MRTALLSVLVLLSAEIAVRAQNPPPVFNPPKSYYLALGDSIAYGFQSFKFAANLPPTAYNTGYVDIFGAHLRQIRPGITTVNFGCPGESTETFVGGHCIWTDRAPTARRVFRQSTAGCHRVSGSASGTSESYYAYPFGETISRSS
jgi:hypothetical protein